MKHFRLITYDGNPKWLSDTLSKSFNPGKTTIYEECSITITDLTEEEVKAIDNYNEELKK